jgi:hypothetical protein
LFLSELFDDDKENLTFDDSSAFPNRLLLGPLSPFADDLDPNTNPDALSVPDDEPNPEDFPLVPTPAKPPPPSKPEDPFPKLEDPFPADEAEVVELNAEADPNPKTFLVDSVEEEKFIEANGLLLPLAGTSVAVFAGASNVRLIL